MGSIMAAIPGDDVTSTLPRTPLSHLVTEIQVLRGRGMTWRAIATIYGVSVGMIYRVAKGNYVPHSPLICQALGLPARVTVAACPVCAGAHTKHHPRRVVRHLDDLTNSELRWLFENRSDYKEAE